MSYSPTLGSVFNRTKMRDPSHVCSFSGMCAMCTADCIGSCEIGLSAVRGMETVYPTPTGENQIASEKVYPVDYSHFNINGRSFGAMGAPLDADRATIYHVGLEREIGTLNPVKLALPIILPALIKLNWPDYFGRQRGHRRRGREQGPDARLRKRQGRPRPEAPGNAGRLQQV